MLRILVCDPLAPDGLAILEREKEFEIDHRTGLKGDALRAALSDADGVVVRSETSLSGDVLAGQSRLKAIVRAGVGVDNIDVPAATRAGIIVMNTPGGNTLSTAEHTVALMLALCRQIPAADSSLRAGRWDRKKFMGKQVAGRTLGIVGLGRIGLAVAKRAQALEMTVVGYDPFLAPEKAAALGIESVKELDDIYTRVDILTVHVPLMDETRSLVGAAQLAKMKKGALVLNCARGGIIDEAALAEALASGHLGGAALDVFAKEPVVDSPLFQLPNVVVTPHLGASTSEAQLSVAIEAAQLLRDYLLTGNIRFAVNVPAIDPVELQDVRHHLDVAYRLGLLQAQLAHGRVKRAVIEYRGEAAQKKTRLITALFTIGLLKNALEQDVNIVNAQVLARERGIQIVEQISSEPGDFSTLIKTEVSTDQSSMIASGTTRGSHYVRLVRLGQYRLDTFIDGTMVFYTHVDKPGLIGFVGTVFGKHGVNIAQMTVGRKAPGGDAIGILAVDSLPPQAALDEIRADGRIRSVQVVNLPPPGETPACLG